ncbi:MAG: NAD(P)-dependent alcohol dehydrogenase [Aurantimicrobium sp.]|uniref:NAD(P)-dependent alcohol dehydrogenase n=1 Tax=Aurantimicrobium sp. TaxID=1930784 RepID=UPI002FC6B18C
MTTQVRAVGAKAEKAPLESLEITRRDVLPEDVRIAVEYSGICHSDIHTVRGDWGDMPYPVVPGHEIIGRVIEVGNNVSKYAVGDLVGVGVIVKSCGECENCLAGDDHFCQGPGGPLLTYAEADPYTPGAFTQGGYSREIVTTEKFVFSIPENLDKAGAAPLLCAGITVYSPLKHWGAGPGKTVGVAGVGGLGHMAVKFAHALGAHTVALTTSPEKVELCKSLGADDVLITSDRDAMKAAAEKFDLIISTLPGDHDMNPFLDLLGLNGSYVVVGAVGNMTHSFSLPKLMKRHRSIAGSQIGSTRETQEMLDFCGEHNIVADIELINADYINEAYDRVVAGDVQFRFVIDAETI